jgi:hypothetical protein
MIPQVCLAVVLNKQFFRYTFTKPESTNGTKITIMLTSLYKNPTRSAFLIILLLGIFSTIYNAYLPLHGDEAYYWVWSHHLQASYYDHPPMIAYMIHLTNFISQHEWGVRLVNVFCMSFTALYIFLLTKLVTDERTALNSTLIFASIILVNAGYIITTPDSPLMLFWSMSLYYSYRAVFIGKNIDFLLTGVAVGLMMLSKYPSILFVAGFLLFLIIKRRDVFLNPYFYASILIALVFVSPVLWWNYMHHWISFDFQLHHGSTDTFTIHPMLVLNFIAGQFGIFSPVFAALLFWFLAKEKLYFRDDKLFFLSMSVVTTLLFFLYKELYKNMELDWVAPSYIGGTILVAIIIEKYKLHKTFKVGLLIAIIFTLIGRAGLMFDLQVFQDRMYGNKQAVHLLETYAKPGDHFYGDHLTIAAYLKYYLPHHPDTDVAVPSRYSQYDMWRKKGFLHNGLVLSMEPQSPYLKTEYKEVKLLKTLTLQRGLHGTKTFYIYRVTSPKK